MRWLVRFDIFMRRVPSMIAMLVLEYCALFALGGGVARLMEPGMGRDGTLWGVVAVGGLLYALALRRIIWPKVRTEHWLPLRPVPGLPLAIAMPKSAVTYRLLSSHPAYALVDLACLPLPILLLAAARDLPPGDAAFFRHFGMATLIGTLALPALRIVCWFLLPRGRAVLAKELEHLQPALRRRAAWEIAWQPPIAFVLLMAGLLGPILYIAWRSVY